MVVLCLGLNEKSHSSVGCDYHAPLDVHEKQNGECVVAGFMVSSAAILCFLLLHSLLQTPLFLPLLSPPEVANVLGARA